MKFLLFTIHFNDFYKIVTQYYLYTILRLSNVKKLACSALSEQNQGNFLIIQIFIKVLLNIFSVNKIFTFTSRLKYGKNHHCQYH